MKKTITIILIMISFIFFINTNITYATNDTDPNPGIFQLAKNWLKLGKEQQNESGARTSWETFNDLAGIVWGAGVCIVLAAGMTLGIKYMFASVEAKAEIKQGLQPLIIGAVIIIGALTIWKFAVELFESVL